MLITNRLTRPYSPQQAIKTQANPHWYYCVVPSAILTRPAPLLILAKNLMYG